MEFIDDHPVVSHRVRFRNRVEIADDQAGLVKDDMTVAWLVRTRCLPPQYHPVNGEDEERYRFNIQAVQHAVPLAGVMRDQALAYLEHGGHQGYVDFGVPRFKQDPMFDAEEFGADAAAHQLARLAEYLHEIGEFREDETALDAVRRLLERRFSPIDHDEPVALGEREPFPVPLGLDTGEVEVVGSIYPNGNRPASRTLIEDWFGPT